MIENIVAIINIFIQAALAVIAAYALFVWKKEIAGKEAHHTAKEYLDYIQKLYFLYHIENSTTYICLNDMLTDRRGFYENDLCMIKSKRFLVSESFFGLFNHISTRSDILLPKDIRELIDQVALKSGECRNLEVGIGYMEAHGVMYPKRIAFGEQGNERKNYLYQLSGMEDLSVEEYFKKWERLINRLKKDVYK